MRYPPNHKFILWGAWLSPAHHSMAFWDISCKLSEGFGSWQPFEICCRYSWSSGDESQLHRQLWTPSISQKAASEWSSTSWRFRQTFLLIIKRCVSPSRHWPYLSWGLTLGPGANRQRGPGLRAHHVLAAVIAVLVAAVRVRGHLSRVTSWAWGGERTHLLKRCT